MVSQKLLKSRSQSGASVLETLLAITIVTSAVYTTQQTFFPKVASKIEGSQLALRGVGTMGGTNPDPNRGKLNGKGGGKNGNSNCSPNRPIDAPPCS